MGTRQWEQCGGSAHRPPWVEPQAVGVQEREELSLVSWPGSHKVLFAAMAQNRGETGRSAGQVELW